MFSQASTRLRSSSHHCRNGTALPLRSSRSFLRFLAVAFSSTVQRPLLTATTVQRAIEALDASIDRHDSLFTVTRLQPRLDEEGRLEFDGEILEADALREKLGAALEDNEQKNVVLRADRHTQHGDVVALMDVIRDAGAEGLTVDAQSSGRSE